jgi:uncharacterized protein (TIGR02246 family)
MAPAKCLSLIAILLLCGCASAPQPDRRAADEAAVRKADADWVKAAQTKQVDAWVAFYSDDAVVLPPNDKLATSKNAIRKAVGDLLGLPDLTITWQPAKVEVARSGDLAYLYGAYEISWTESGKTSTDRGKNLEVWKKQMDGSWKCVADTWNSDLPAGPAPPAK